MRDLLSPGRICHRADAARPASGGSAPSNRCAPHATDRMRCGAREGQTGEDPRRPETRERGAARAHLGAQRGEPAHQREPRSRDRAPRGRRDRPVADRRAPRRHRHHRRGGRATGLRHLGHHRGGAPGHRGVDRGPAALRVFPRSRGTAPDRRRFGLCAGARLPDRPAAVEDLPGHADAPSRRPCRQLLSGREGGRRAVHRRGRGDPGAVRLAGRDRDRQCADLPRRAAGAGRPRGADRDLAGRRRRVRRRHRPPGLAQPRGAADRGQPAHAGPHRRGPARDPHLPLRRRARDRPRQIAAGAGAEQRRDGARRGDRAHDPRRAQPSPR